MATPQLHQQVTYEVHLAIYDLSRGMARSLSAQFLGPNHAIDVIPHTGIIVYGKEYYFGGNGIECSEPTHFRSTRGLFPIQTQNLGVTRVSKAQFEDWCRTHGHSSSMFSNLSYDLFERNCNNFSQHAITDGLCLPNVSVPEWVLNVPRRVLSSPMGQLIRPIMEQMKITGPTGGGANADFNTVTFSETNETNPWISYPSTGVNNEGNVDVDASQNSSSQNPWANLSSTTNGDRSTASNVIMAQPIETSQSSPLVPVSSKEEEEERILKVLTFLYRAQKNESFRS